MAAELFYLPGRAVMSLQGFVASGALLEFFTTGTTDPLAVYADEALTQSLGTSLTSNAAGRFPTIYLDNTNIYRVRCTLGATTLFDVDPYYPGDAAEATADLLEAAARAEAAAARAEAAANDGGGYYSTIAAGAAATSAPQTFISDESGVLVRYDEAGNAIGRIDIADGINVAAYGTIPNIDSADAHTANVAAFAAAVTAALSEGKPLVIPGDEFYFTADNGTSTGLTLTVPDNGKLTVIGLPGATIKRRANTSMVSTSSLVWMTGNTGAEYEFIGVTFDGNEANCDLDSLAVTATGDGVTTVWNYTGAVSPGVVRILSNGSFSTTGVAVTVTGSTGAWVVTFATAPAVGVNHLIYEAYKHEQSANIKWKTGTGTPHKLAFHRCDVGKNRVGDGYHANVQVDHFIASDCVTTDSVVRRTRADWQFSRYAKFGTLMSNIECGSWESEPASTTTTMFLMLSNVLAHTSFDLAGDTTGTTRYPVRLRMSNVTCLATEGRGVIPFVNFWRVHGEGVNCHFRRILRFQRNKMVLRGGTITVMAVDGTTDAEEMLIFHEQSTEGSATYPDSLGNFVVLENIDFFADSTVTTGGYIGDFSTATLAGQLGEEMVSFTMRNCRTRKALPYVFAGVGRAGRITVEGGHLRASTAIIRCSNDSTFYNEMRIVPNMYWTAPALIEFSAGINVTGTKFHIHGQWDGEVMAPTNSGTVNTSASVTWNVDAQILVDSNPNGRIKTLPGLAARIRTPTINTAAFYRASYSGAMTTTGYGNTVWVDPIGVVITGSATYNPPSIAAGASTSTTVTVTGAVLGDYVTSVSFSLDSAGVLMRGYVSAADTVTVYLTNVTGSPVDLASGTLRAAVRKL